MQYAGKARSMVRVENLAKDGKVKYTFFILIELNLSLNSYAFSCPIFESWVTLFCTTLFDNLILRYVLCYLAVYTVKEEHY